MLRKVVTKEIVPSTPEMANSPAVTVSADSSPSKKSVRFAPEASSPSTSMSTGFSALSAVTSSAANVTTLTDTDTIFLDGFNSTMERVHPNDVFIHRQTRLESTHTQRRNFSAAYCRALADEYEISEPSRPTSTRPISTMLPAPSPEDDEKRDTIAAVERERQALEQVTLATWELEALSYIRKGLLIKEVEAHIKSTFSAQILDFGGKPNCDWGWKIATDHPNANVCTAYLGARDILTGPANHTALEFEKPFALPFADNTFDLISARSLHSLLKNDEIALTLSELHRVLKPSGYLDFCLLDALLINVAAGSWGQVMNAEFGHKLQQRGYEREPSKHFQARLQHAGFHSVKRVWMFLGMSDVCPIWTDAGKTSAARAPTKPLPSLPGSAKFAPREKSLPKPTGTVHYKVEVKDAGGNLMLGPNGKPTYYPPALTGSTEAVAPVTGLSGARMWEQWVYKFAREMGGKEAEKQMLEQVCGVLEQGGKMGSGFGCLMGVARK